MSLRFRRSIKLAPGVRLNLSGSGASLSVGPRGASMSFGSRGAYLNAGIPGTGLYSRTRLSARADSPPSTLPRPETQRVNVSARISVEDDGNVRFLDADGNPLSDYLTLQAKRQRGQTIREFLEDMTKKLNSSLEDLASLHLTTPKPTDKPVRAPRDFPSPQPVPPIPVKVGIWNWLTGKRAEIENANAVGRREYDEALERWRRVKTMFDAREQEACKQFDRRLAGDVAFMHQVLEDNLQDIVWPRETLVSFQIVDGGGEVGIDVDLPEIEDMPHRIARLPDRGYQIAFKELTQKALRDLYLRHVHSLGFRLIGEAFATLPSVTKVTLSGFTQRDDPATGNRADVYVYSVRVDRGAWSGINFANLAAIDVVASFDRFEVRRKIERNRALGCVEPL